MAYRICALCRYPGKMASRLIETAVGLVVLSICTPTQLPCAARGPCAVAGRILDDKGKPVPFGVVHATREAADTADLERRDPGMGAAAGQRGEYCIANLPPGRYVIRAAVRKNTPSASPTCRYCCGRSTELASPTRSVLVSFDGTSTSRVDIQMRRVAAYCVRGEMRDATGALADSVAINIRQAHWSASVLNHGGRFLITNLIPGDYEISIMGRPGVAGRALTKRKVTVRAANIDRLVISIPGKVTGPAPWAR